MIKKFFGGLVLVVVVIGVLASLKSPKEIENEIHTEVASDSIKEYELAKKHGDRADLCVRAGIVAEAFLSAHDEASYAKWRDIERADCKRAGL